MSREMVQTAAKLLAKAQSTTSDHEAIALVERAYRLLAKAINTYDAEHESDAPRRRERRRLLERRRCSRTEAGVGAPTEEGAGGDGRSDRPLSRHHRRWPWRRLDVRL